MADIEADLRRWEDRAHLNIATLIDVYLAQQPPPAPSRHATLYRQWARELRAAGQGARPLASTTPRHRDAETT